jgi:molybdate transport system ATP-binding protein
MVGEHELEVAERVNGDVLLTIRPNALSVHAFRPEGSARNSWQTHVELFERLDERVRLRTGPPLPLTVEITARSAETLHIQRGSSIWLSVKATEIGVEQNAS